MQLNIRTLFLIDAIGAGVSAVSLGIVLPQLQTLFGMPVEALYIFSAMALIFFIYSILNYLRPARNSKLFLKGIAITNLLYCFLTVGSLFYFRHELTLLGYSYFIAEVTVILFLVRMEWNATRPVREVATGRSI